MFGYLTDTGRKSGSATYAEITGPSGFLSTLTPFAGNSMWAQWEGESYVVYSYSTEIARVRKTSDGYLVTLNDHRYSRTTSRHQGAVAAWLGYSFGRRLAS